MLLSCTASPSAVDSGAQPQTAQRRRQHRAVRWHQLTVEPRPLWLERCRADNSSVQLRRGRQAVRAQEANAGWPTTGRLRSGCLLGSCTLYRSRRRNKRA